MVYKVMVHKERIEHLIPFHPRLVYNNNNTKGFTH